MSHTSSATTVSTMMKSSTMQHKQQQHLFFLFLINIRAAFHGFLYHGNESLDRLQYNQQSVYEICYNFSMWECGSC